MQRCAPLVLEEVRLGPEIAADADALLRDAIRVSAPRVPSVDAYRYEELSTVILDALLSGGIADRGLKVTDLARAGHIGRGRLSDHFGGAWQQFTDLVVRTICVQTDRPTLYEEMYSLPVQVGRDDNSLGTDRHPRVRNSLHLLVWAIASKNLHCPTLAQPLTAGTRDDRTSARCDRDRVNRYEEQLDWALPATFAENIRSLLGRGFKLGDAVAHDPLASAFSPYLIVGELPCGPPDKPHRDSYQKVLPGCDEAIVNAVYERRRRGMLYAGTPAAQADSDEGGFAIDSSFVRWAIPELPGQKQLNINRPFGVDYLWSSDQKVFVRRAGALTEFWRLANIQDEHLATAAAIIERHAQHVWPANCMTRWATDASVGRLGASHALTRQGCLDLLNAANAAAVAAERCRREQA